MARKLNLLIIDDEPACLTSLSMQLYTANANLILVDNAKEGIKILQEKDKEIDLILLDLMMPGMDGIEFLDEIANAGLFRNKPIIIQTGLINKEQIKKAMKKGCVAYITKPFEKDSLFQIINQYSTIKI